MSSSQYMLRFNNDIDEDDVSLIAIDDIWKATCDEISARWLSTLDTPIAAQIALCKVKKMAAWSIVNHDGIPGLNIPSIQEEALERYIPDEEPIPSTIDQWARGTVPTRKQKEEISLFPIKSSGSATPSVSSMRSSNTAKTGTSKGSKYSKSSYRSEGGTKVSRLEDQDMTGQIIELDDPDGEFGDLNANGALFDMLKKQQRQNQNGNKKEIIAEDKFNVMQAQIDKAKEDLKKGKKVPKFTIDKEGVLTKIVPVKPEGLPPFSVPLGLSISAAREIDKRPGSRPSTKASADANDGDVKRKKKVVKVVGARAIDESYFIASHTLATTLSGVDNISLVSPGVSVYDGNNKREGQPIPEDPKRQSRKQYLSRSQVLNGAGEGSMLDSRGGLGSPSFGGLDGESTEFNNSFIGLPASMSNFSIKDMNAFEGGRQIIRETGPSVSDDFYGDVEIGQQVSSVLPTKPSGKQKLNIDLLSGGTTKGRPRERETLTVAMPLTSTNKHLPAPAPGHVVGHGFIKTSPEKDKSKVLGGSSVLNRSQASQGANIIKKDNPNLARALSYNN